MTGLPLERTRFAGVYRRGSRFVVVYRSGGRQRKQAAATLAEARAIKLVRDAEARAQRSGPTPWDLQRIGALGLEVLRATTDNDAESDLRERLLERGFYDAKDG